MGGDRDRLKMLSLRSLRGSDVGVACGFRHLHRHPEDMEQSMEVVTRLRAAEPHGSAAASAAPGCSCRAGRLGAQSRGSPSSSGGHPACTRGIH